MNLLRDYLFKQDIIRLFEKHQDELVVDNGVEVIAHQQADARVYALGYGYCSTNNLHLSLIQRIRGYFKQWVEDRDVDRAMRVW